MKTRRQAQATLELHHGTPKKNGRINKKNVAVKTVTGSELTTSMHTILIVATGTANRPSSGTVVSED